VAPVARLWGKFRPGDHAASKIEQAAVVAIAIPSSGARRSRLCSCCSFLLACSSRQPLAWAFACLSLLLLLLAACLGPRCCPCSWHCSCWSARQSGAAAHHNASLRIPVQGQECAVTRHAQHRILPRQRVQQAHVAGRQPRCSVQDGAILQEGWAKGRSRQSAPSS